jgi:hypothetical protein
VHQALSTRMSTIRFDPGWFERLEGAHLGMHAVPLLKQAIPESEFLPYFREKAAGMDPCHLEVAIALLRQVGTEGAYYEAAKYLEYPDFSIQFVAVKVIQSVPAVDEHIMRCVVDSLNKHKDDPLALAQELKVCLDRPSSPEAARIAGEYLNSAEAQ